MSSFSLNLLFPTPLLSTEEHYSITKEELEFIEKHSELTYENAGNTTSLNKKILDEPEMRKISDFIKSAINYYTQNIITVEDDVEFYITTSWLNYTKPNQFHHKHAHANSIISGVFYINADKDVDKILFFKDNEYQRIQLPVKQLNSFNSCIWWVPVETGKLILFDSSLHHMVEKTKSSKTRVSLAFNVFCKGNIGYEKDLTQLEI
jgi:uncharacterized protein (TIGR02466 family)